jgi:ribonucleoside-triphosphate reductase
MNSSVTNMNESQRFILVSKYARWLETENRRESSWEESATRYLDFMKAEHPKVPPKIWKLAEKRMLELGVVPSMRAVQMAGPALKANNILGYNCCYVPFDSLKAVVDLFYVLMCAAGVGFSSEGQYIGTSPSPDVVVDAGEEYTSQMPVVKPWNGDGAGIFVVDDSTEGWCRSLMAGFDAWFYGKDIEFDYSKIRKRGTRLKTKGGRASGPAPLKRLHDFCRETICRAQGRKLNSQEWLDIGNMIGDIVVVGGVRRASEINFSDLNDDLIRYAKDYSKGPVPQYRSNSNNSAVYYSKPSSVEFMKEWASLAASGSGERGIFNLSAIKNMLPARRKFTIHFRCNPCAEILLRPRQFCNLTEVVVRAWDDFDDLIEKVKVAVWLGAIQACMTDFPFIDPQFKKNCDEERLLGVSLTGQMDNPKLMTPEKLQILKKYAIKEAAKASKLFGINMPAAITTGKPSGTVSKLVESSDGAHPRYAPFYIRRYRLAAIDPLFRMMRDQGVKFSPENGQGPEAVEEKRAALIAKGRSADEARVLVPDWTEDQVQTWVFGIPVAAPKGSIVRSQVTAIQQLEWYLKMVENWCEHNQSITVYVRDDEWVEVGAWVYKHFDKLVAVSFLPYDGGVYKQAPYEEITKETFEKLSKDFPKIDYSKLSAYELEDNTTSAQQLACQGAGCDA